MTAAPDADDFADFAAALGRDASRAHADPALADAYWRARRAGHTHPAVLATTRSLGNATNPVGLVLTRLRGLATSPPPQRRTVGRHEPYTHEPCPDGHPGCVLCRCTERTVHHVPTPMPDWFRQAWREHRMSHVGAMPTDDEQAS